jgi:hypothetical protein
MKFAESRSPDGRKIGGLSGSQVPEEINYLAELIGYDLLDS